MEKKFLIPLALVGLLVTTGCGLNTKPEADTDSVLKLDNDEPAISVTEKVEAGKPVDTAKKPVIKTEPVISANTTAEKPAEVTKVTSIEQILGTWKVTSNPVPGGENVITLMKGKSYYAITIGGKAYDSGYWTFAGNSLVLHTNAAEVTPMKYVGMELYGADELHLIDSPFTKAQVWQRVK